MTEPELATVRAAWRARTLRVIAVELPGREVIVKGERAARAAWRAGATNVLARAAGLPLLQNAGDEGGAAAQAIEVARLRALCAAGLPVPDVLHDEPGFFVMNRIAGPSLVDTIDRASGGARLEWWRRGQQALLEVHRRGHYLSQAFARNFIAIGDSLAMIDFEDDPGAILTLDEAQARDWLAYLHSTAWRLPGSPATLAAIARHRLDEERPAVRALVEQAGRRLAWLRHLPSSRRPFGREVVGLQALAALLHQAFPRAART